MFETDLNTSVLSLLGDDVFLKVLAGLRLFSDAAVRHLLLVMAQLVWQRIHHFNLKLPLVIQTELAKLSLSVVLTIAVLDIFQWRFFTVVEGCLTPKEYGLFRGQPSCN